MSSRPSAPQQRTAMTSGKFAFDTDEASAMSERVARMGLREGMAYETQLQCVLAAAIAKPPPAGVDTGEVERRMRMLQVALTEVQVRLEELHRAQAQREQQRYAATQQRRAAGEVAAEERRAFQDNERQQLVEEMRDAQVAYFKDRNQRTDEKAVSCQEHNYRAHAETIHQATANEGRRERNLETLMEERDRRRRELRARDLARQQSIREANRRKAVQVEADRRALAHAAEIREQETAAKLAALRESTRCKSVAKASASRAKSTVVFRNGQAILETEAKDHGQLLEDLDAKTAGQQARYADERADEMLYLQQRAAHRELRVDRQQANLVRLIDKRLSRGGQIVVAAKAKKERAEVTKEAQANMYIEHGVELRKDVAAHRRRARAIQQAREQEALANNYRRWNGRAARIVADLTEAIEQDCAEQEAAAAREAAAHTHNHSTPVALEAGQSGVRFPHLPSPSDFAV